MLAMAELRRLNDTLAQTPLAKRYWVRGGMLLGWAREGRILANDTADADFGFFSDDIGIMISAVPALEGAGFRLYAALRNNHGRLTAFVFHRSGIQFDFLAIERIDGKFCLYAYYDDVQVYEETPAQQLVPFEFAGRTWLRVEDVDLELSALYGDWRRPRPDWDYLRDSPALVAVAPRRYGDPRPRDLTVQY
jgi:hypothetical protein